MRPRDYIGAFIAIFIVAPLLWFALDRSPPFQVISGRISPENPAPGTDIEIIWHVKPLRLCSLHRATVTRTIIDSIGIPHKYEPVKAVFSGESKILRMLTLPPTMAPGPARYSSLACYPCNPLQEFWPVCVQTPDIVFNVASDDVRGQGR